MLKRRRATAATVVIAAAALSLAGAAMAGSLNLRDGMMGSPPPPFRDIQETIWFQGFVADAGTGEPVNATYTVVARIYDSDAGGSTVWGSESHAATEINDGWFNIELGSILSPLPAFDTPPYYLQLTINGETLAPRLKLASVPSAFQSLGADNGLNLPYSGNYGTSGTVFSITNTGPNICGYFKIDNPGSSAGAVYGRHNGTGAAVIGWHDGTGPAIKGVANGDGLAGYFDGEVQITDTLRVDGAIMTDFVISEQGFATAGTLMTRGFWMNKNPEPGYVMQCQDDIWGAAAWAPPNVIDVHNEGSEYILGDGDVHQYDNCQVTLDVPGPGYIAVTSNVSFKFYHQGGITDRLYLSHSTSTTSLGSWYDTVVWEVPDDLVGDTDLDRTFSVHSMFEVTSSGSYTYYLVGQMNSGGTGGDRFWNAQMTGIYYPYPILARSDEGEDVDVLRKKAELESQ